MAGIGRPVWVVILIMVGAGCQGVPLESGAPSQAADCQGCHQSPPPTGGHSFHFFMQTRRKQITCDECHASSVRNLRWRFAAQRVKSGSWSRWDTLQVQGDRFTLVMPEEEIHAFSLCRTQVRGDTLFGLSRDGVELVKGARDSLAMEGEDFRFLPLKRYYYRIDTITDVFGTRYDSTEVREFGAPRSYDGCLYQVAGDTLYRLRAGSYDTAVRVLDEHDSLVVREIVNRIYVISADVHRLDTLAGHLREAGHTWLAQLPEDQWGQFETQVGGQRRVLEGYATRSYRIDTNTRTLTDTSLYQIMSGTLFRLKRDSSMPYQDLWGETLRSHMNGKVDVKFLHESSTLYREDTLAAVIDSLTGLVKDYLVKSTGSWMPERQSCNSLGIRSAGCHDGVTGLTPWLMPPERMGRLPR